MRRRGARRQPLSRIRAADLRGGARTRRHRGARRRPADADVRRAVPDRHPCGVFRRVSARHHRPRRPRRRARRDCRHDAVLSRRHPGPAGRALARGRQIAQEPGLRGRRDRHAGRVTCSTARLRSRSRKAVTWSRRCVSPRRRPGSNARVLAAACRLRAAPRSKPCWRGAKARLPVRLSSSALLIEFQLRENSLLDTPQKRRGAKRSFYRARRDDIYFPCKGLAPMDAIDRKILALLQQDASHSVAEIGSLVGLSSTPCWKRIQRLEADGVIQRRVALVDQDKLGLGVTVFVSIETGDHSQQWLDRFAAEVGAMPEVMEFYRMAGDVDYMLRVVVPDIAGYDAFYKRLIAAVPLKNVTSRFAMEKIKATTALPIP